MTSKGDSVHLLHCLHLSRGTEEPSLSAIERLDFACLGCSALAFEVKEMTLEENEQEQVIHSKVLVFLQRVCQDCIPLTVDLLLSNHEGHLLVFPKLE
jgi:hypothetical protein